MKAEHVDGKVVEGSPAEFGDGDAKPDGLDGAVQSPVSVQTKDALEDQCMELIARNVPLITSRASDAANLNFLTPYVFTVTKDRNKTFLYVNIGLAPTHLIDKYLQGTYGPEILKSGIQKAIDFQKAEISLESLLPFFPEFEYVITTANRCINKSDNPYLSILALPFEMRPFVAGATDAGILNGRIRNSYDESSVLNFPLEFKDFFFYAKDIGKVEAVAEMFDQYKNAAEKLK